MREGQCDSLGRHVGDPVLTMTPAHQIASAIVVTHWQHFSLGTMVVAGTPEDTQKAAMDIFGDEWPVVRCHRCEMPQAEYDALPEFSP